MIPVNSGEERFSLMAKIPVGILGATGMVGQRFIQLLENHPWFEVAWIAASERSFGKPYEEAAKWKMKTPIPARIARMVVSAAEPKGAPKVIFAALDAEFARDLEPAFADAGCAVISNSSAFRMHPQVPLVIPEINPDHLKLIDQQTWRKKSGGFMVTNSNCSIMGLAVCLAPLQKLFGIEAVFAVTMQAISGAGYPGVASLDILGNVVPYIRNEEEKMQEELGKLLGKLKARAGRRRRLPHQRPLQPRRGRRRTHRIHLHQAQEARHRRKNHRRLARIPRPDRRSQASLRPGRGHLLRRAPRPSPAAPRSRPRPWHDRHLRTPASLLAARLEVHHALAQHHPRRRRSRAAQRRTAQGPGLLGLDGPRSAVSRRRVAHICPLLANVGL